jgi:hypothetical protein
MAPQHPAQRGDDAFITQKFAEPHSPVVPFRRR